MNLITVSFRVVARSSNTNSFGLRGHVLVSRNGNAVEVARSDYSGNEPWAVNSDVTVPAVTTDAGISLQWARVGCEIPRALPKPPVKLLKQIFAK